MSVDANILEYLIRKVSGFFAAGRAVETTESGSIMMFYENNVPSFENMSSLGPGSHDLEFEQASFATVEKILGCFHLERGFHLTYQRRGLIALIRHCQHKPTPMVWRNPTVCS